MRCMLAVGNVVNRARHTLGKVLALIVISGVAGLLWGSNVARADTVPANNLPWSDCYHYSYGADKYHCAQTSINYDQWGGQYYINWRHFNSSRGGDDGAGVAYAYWKMDHSNVWNWNGSQWQQYGNFSSSNFTNATWVSSPLDAGSLWVPTIYTNIYYCFLHHQNETRNEFGQVVLYDKDVFDQLQHEMWTGQQYLTDGSCP